MLDVDNELPQVSQTHFEPLKYSLTSAKQDS